jgi:hypothetical protein
MTILRGAVRKRMRLERGSLYKYALQRTEHFLYSRNLQHFGHAYAEEVMVRDRALILDSVPSVELGNLGTVQKDSPRVCSLESVLGRGGFEGSRKAMLSERAPSLQES